MARKWSGAPDFCLNAKGVQTLDNSTISFPSSEGQCFHLKRFALSAGASFQILGAARCRNPSQQSHGAVTACVLGPLGATAAGVRLSFLFSHTAAPNRPRISGPEKSARASTMFLLSGSVRIRCLCIQGIFLPSEWGFCLRVAVVQVRYGFHTHSPPGQKTHTHGFIFPYFYYYCFSLCTEKKTFILFRYLKL